MRLQKEFACIVLFTLLIAGLCTPAACAAAPQKKPAANAAPTLRRKGRDTLALDGSAWRFQTDAQGQGETAGWSAAIPDSAKIVAVPAFWNALSAPGYRGMAWYWRTFSVPAKWKGQTVRLRFGAVAESARVWLNGTEIGTHAGGATPFAFNVTKTLHFDGDNLLTVRAQSNESKSAAANAAGIWQSVTLLAHDEAYLADVFPQGDGLGHLSVAVELLNTSQVSGDSTLDAKLTADDAPARELKATNQNLSLTPGRNLTTIETGLKAKTIRRWSPDTPVLYRVGLSFRQGDDVLDTESVPFGFRQFGLANNAVTLNGEPLALKAVTLAPTSPFESPFLDDDAQAREILRHTREKGANVVYLAAPPPAFLRAGDAEGVFVVESARAGLAPDSAAREMQELIRRDRAHPCLLAWNLGSASLAQTAACRVLDPTRFFLVGPDNNAALWLPGDNPMPTMTIPPGFRPAR